MAERAPDKPRQDGRRFRRLAKVAVVLIVAAVLLNFIADNPYTHRLVRGVIDRAVRAGTHLTVDFNAIKVSVVPPGVDLYGVQVATDADTRQPLLTAAHLRARLSLWSLILGEIRIAVAEAEDLAFIWPPPFGFTGFMREEAGAAPAPATAPPTWPPAFELPLDRLILRNAQVYVEVPLTETVPLKSEHMILSAVGVDLDVTYDNWRAIAGTFATQALSFSLGAASLVEDARIGTGFSVHGTELRLAGLKLDADRSRFDGGGSVSLETAGRERIWRRIAMTLEGRAETDLSVLGSYLDLTETRGLVGGDVKVSLGVPVSDAGPVTWRVEGRGRSHDAILAGFRLLDTRTAFAVDKDGLKLSEVEVAIGDAVYGRGEGVIRFDDLLGYDFLLATDGLRLTDLLGALGVEFGMIDAGINSPDLRITGTGMPFALTVSASAEFAGLALPETPYDHGPYPVPPDCRLDFHLAVTGTQLDFTGTSGSCYQPPARPGAVRAGRVEPPAGAGAVSTVVLGGQIFFDADKGLNLSVLIPQLDLAVARHFAVIDLDGAGEATVRVHGPFARVLIDAGFSAQGVEVMQVPLGGVSGRVTVDGKSLRWSGVRATPGGEAGWIEAGPGQLDFGSAPMMFESKLKAAGLSSTVIRRMVRALDREAAFGLAVNSLDGQVRFPVDAPLALTGALKIQVSDVELGEERLADRVAATVTGTPAGLVVSGLKAGLGTLELTGDIQHVRRRPWTPETVAAAPDQALLGVWLDDQLTVTLKAGPTPGAGKDADHLGSLPFAGKALAGAGIKGVLVATARLSGAATDLQGTFQGTLRQPSVMGARLAPLNFKGFVNGGRFDLVFDHAGNTFEGRLSLDLKRQGIPYEWFFNFNRFDLRMFATDHFYTDPRNYLYLTANWHMQGFFADWWRSRGELEMSDVRAKYVTDIGAQTKALTMTLEHPAKVLFTDKGWTFEGEQDLYLGGKYSQLRVSMVDNRPPERLGLHLEGVVDVAVARDLVPAVETAAGKIRITGDISGPVTDPKLLIEVTDLKPNPFIAATWTPVTFGLADARPAFRNVRFSVKFDGERLTIDQFSAEKGVGTVSAAGTLELAAAGEATPGDSRVDIKLEDATFIYPVAFLKTFESQLSGTMAILPGKAAPVLIRGDLDIVRGRSTREVDIRNEIINALRQRSLTTNLVSDTPVVELDVNLRANQSINIHNRNVQALVSLELALRGNDIAPSVTGQVKVDKGRFIYKRDFQVIRGIVTFDDPVKPDPALDILAVSEVDAYRVYINITGRGSNPTVEFSVDPPTRPSGTPLNKLEILVLLSRGKLPDESRSIGEQTQKAAASEAFNMILGQFEEPVEKLFDLSGQSVVRNPYIDTHPADDGSPVPRLNLPLDLGEDFDVVVRADRDTNEVSTEYSVHENITFSGALERKRADEERSKSAGDKRVDGDARLNLKFRFSFE